MMIGLTASLLLARFGRGDAGSAAPPEFGADTWGTLKDAKRGGLLDDKGVVLGKLDGRLLTYHGAEAVLVSGATRSGKGRGTVVPTLLSHPESAFILDTKEELFFGTENDEYRFEGTSGWRSTFGHCLYFNPLDRRSARFNPLFEVRKGENEVGDAQAIAAILTDPAGVRDEPDIWDMATREFYTGLILHQLYAAPDSEKTLGGVRRQLVRPMNKLSWEMQHPLHLTIVLTPSSSGQPRRCWSGRRGMTGICLPCWQRLTRTCRCSTTPWLSGRPRRRSGPWATSCAATIRFRSTCRCRHLTRKFDHPASDHDEAVPDGEHAPSQPR